MKTKINLSKIDWKNPSNSVQEILDEAKSRNSAKGQKKFNELFFNGGEVILKEGVRGTWKEDMYIFCLRFMRSFEPRHEDKEAVCAMILEECLEL